MSKKEIKLKIETGRGSDTFTFDETAKVSEVIAVVVNKFDYQSGNYSLVFGTEVLSQERPLVSYHLKDGDVLQLSDTGGGV